jgi:hypothetical protein
VYWTDTWHDGVCWWVLPMQDIVLTWGPAVRAYRLPVEAAPKYAKHPSAPRTVSAGGAADFPLRAAVTASLRILFTKKAQNLLTRHGLLAFYKVFALFSARAE